MPLSLHNLPFTSRSSNHTLLLLSQCKVLQRSSHFESLPMIGVTDETETLNPYPHETRFPDHQCHQDTNITSM